MHLKPTAGCQISTLIFGFRGRPYTYLMNNCERGRGGGAGPETFPVCRFNVFIIGR
jgi:hypothetical protein